MGDQDDKCPRCGGSLRSAAGGSITQWVASCRCGNAVQRDEADNNVAVQLCKSCGKRIQPGRKGSFTQWVFRSDLCSCSNPEPFVQDSEQQANDNLRPLLAETDVEEPLLQLPDDSFPSERYKPISVLGEGASATVYLCRDRLLSKQVAVKTLKSLDNQQLVAFQREAKALSRLDHPNVVRVFDFGASKNGSPFMVMDYVEGKSLDKLIATGKTLSVSDALKIFIMICDGLSDAHKKGIFHRDVKSSNIIITETDSEQFDAKIVDFGIAAARAAQEDSIVIGGVTIAGTPQYMSPDQALGHSYDERSEIYAIGCALFEALTGAPPFQGDSALSIINQHATRPAPSLSEAKSDSVFPESLELLVSKCLAKQPDDRYQSVDELNDAINSVLNGAEESQPESQVLGKSSRAPTKKIMIVSLLTLASISLLTVFTFAVNRSPEEASPRISQGPLIPVFPEVPNTTLLKQFARAKIDGKVFLVSTDDVTDDDLAALENEKNFDGIYLINQQITGRGLSHLQNSPVRSVFVTDTPISSEGYEAIARIKTIESLYIGNVPVTADDITRLRSLSRLKQLDLSNCKISKDVLKEIGSLASIESLVLSGVSGIEAADIAQLSSLPNLTKIDLSNSKNVYSDLTGLGQLKKLKHLVLVRAGLNNFKMQQLRNLKLETLTLTHNIEVSDDGIFQVASMSTLRRLSTLGCSVTAEGLRQLKIELPGCEVEKL